MNKQTQTDDAAIVAGCNEFALELYRLLAANTEENILFSPSSMVFALAMTMTGARGETERQMAETMHLPLEDGVHESFRQLAEHTRSAAVQFHIANRLFGQKDYVFRKEFLAATKRFYRAPLEAVDFGRCQETCKCINAWVDKETKHKIREIVQPGDISPDTRLVLANAVHFLAKWHAPFRAEKTEDKQFRCLQSGKCTVPMMQQSRWFRLGSFPTVQVLELPYRQTTGRDGSPLGSGGMDPAFIEGGFVMQILLPRKDAGLAKLESSLTLKQFTKLSHLEPCKVDVSMPKFRAESFYQMQEQLKELGMRQPFSLVNADFSGMTDDPRACSLILFCTRP